MNDNQPKKEPVGAEAPKMSEKTTEVAGKNVVDAKSNTATPKGG